MRQPKILSFSLASQKLAEKLAEKPAGFMVNGFFCLLLATSGAACGQLESLPQGLLLAVATCASGYF